MEKHSKFSGLSLILLGLLILLYQQGIDVFTWQYVRSYGFILVGLFFLFRGIKNPSRGGVYLGSFLILMGLYFGLAMYDIYELSRGLTISIFTIALGLPFYSLFAFRERKWSYLLYGNIITLIGFLFLLESFGELPPEFLQHNFDTYWPVLLILWGLTTMIGAAERKSKVHMQKY